MNDLRELYQEVILDHNRAPRHKHAMPEASAEAKGHNPLCGDQVTVFLKMDGDKIADVSFEGQGCAISTASASLMTEAVLGKTRAEAEVVFESFRDAMTHDHAALPDDEAYDSLRALEGVKDFPVRVKCATLAWHTLHAALNQKSEATTE